MLFLAGSVPVRLLHFSHHTHFSALVPCIWILQCILLSLFNMFSAVSGPESCYGSETLRSSPSTCSSTVCSDSCCVFQWHCDASYVVWNWPKWIKKILQICTGSNVNGSWRDYSQCKKVFVCVTMQRILNSPVLSTALGETFKWGVRRLLIGLCIVLTCFQVMFTGL